ncbi:hypothetical protein MLD38_031020 [Melastoma candidum]|uniref:Uncharacterized protein n=1 Tax=Melastoma candidum TaxID=119954 RepID=A0ACB9MPL0_9MYRT|nr:hypothetical protein MLD38_031020 [Melastoma candidum]
MEGRHDMSMASRKAEESANRRYQAAEWLDGLVGPLGISLRPSEGEFLSCLRNGQVLCNVINRIKPGSVPKVVENNHTLQPDAREPQPLPAFQYFENVRNFLLAVEELKLSAFEASDLERESLDAGSASRVVDCVLGMKAYHEWKQMSNSSANQKCLKSPLIMRLASKINSQNSTTSSEDSCRRLLDMSDACDKQQPGAVSGRAGANVTDAIIKSLVDGMIEAKENIGSNLFTSISKQKIDIVKVFGNLISTCMSGHDLGKYPELDQVYAELLEAKGQAVSATHLPLQEVSESDSCRICSKNSFCNHRKKFELQKKEILNIKVQLSKTKQEFNDLQTCFQKDLADLLILIQEMSSAAIGYHKVVKENRNLYNMVQDLKGNIRVYCRIRPVFNAEAKSVINFVGQDGSIVVRDPTKPQREGSKLFQFNYCFGPYDTQDDIYLETQPLIRSVMDGYNVCIFAYGQTGSGKTYTMSGPSGGSLKDAGINYRALNDLFEISNRRKDVTDYHIQVQMVEIYNEQVRDLLTDSSSMTKYPLTGCSNSYGLSLPDATLHQVESPTDVLNLMKLGELNRAVSSTALNAQSSRSHSVLTVHVQGKDVSGSNLRSCLHLVDLAGSERVDKSEVTGESLREAQHINRSLSCLADVISALAQKNSHIPYRNSKLTLLLQDSLGGHGKTLMFAHVNPEEDSFLETISTLKFAQRVSSVELGTARLNKESSEVLQLKEQVESLKKALAIKEMRRSELSNVREPKTPPGIDQMSLPERTPPPSSRRRSSMENCKTGKGTNPEGKTEKVPASCRGIGLGIEVPTTGEKYNYLHSVAGNGLITPPLVEISSHQKSKQIGNKDIPGSCGHFVQKENLKETCSSSLDYPLSPKSSKKRLILKKDERQQSSPLRFTKSPEPFGNIRTTQTVAPPDLAVQSITAKKSQIRKSLRTIGKLINGPEKRSRDNSAESCSSDIKGKKGECFENSEVTASARSLRRRSLTGGIQASIAENSRRSSIGGKSTDSSTNTARNARTLPPARLTHRL